MGTSVARCMIEGRQCTGPSSSPLSVCFDDSASPTLYDDFHCMPSHDYFDGTPKHPVHSPTTTNLNIPDLGTSSFNSDHVEVEDKGDSGPVYNTTTEPSEKGQWCCRRLKWNVWHFIGRKSKSECQQEKEDEDEDRLASLHKKFTKEQWFLLLVLLLGSFTCYVSLCLFPPFLPKIAQEKGCSSFIIGLIIGTNCLTTFLFTPTVGKKLKLIGLKFAFSAGLFCSGGCCILAGFLEWFPPGPVFVVFAVLIRMVQAVGVSGVNTATFAYIGIKFPQCLAKVFSWTRTAANLAQMFGPVIGGAMLEVGGFKLPFIVMGTIQMTMTIVASYLLPKFCESRKKSEESDEEIELWKIATIKGIWVSFITFILSTMSNGFLSITLEPQVLRMFGLRSLYVGVLFGLKDGVNSFASPLWGLICDHYRHVKIFILLASCFAFTSFFLLGPFPGVPINRSLGIVIVAMVFNGIGIGGQQVAGVVDSMREAVGAGLPDDAATHGCIAGLWASLSGAGRFTSRTGSGFLVDTIGFQKTCFIIICLHGFVVVMTTVYMSLFRDGPYNCHNDEGKDHLVQKTEDTEGRIQAVLTTTPSEPVTTKTVNISIPGYKEDLEDSNYCGSEPMPSSITRYSRANLFMSQSLECA
ncbi:MFS-type transporter SLC18B1-like [Panulirus ornatus]|uniref:MFS-type transporter SLC18B1-like n=1 Tax=Panulirus ornatus TaxID=150431 RepID=UPI003A8B90FE